MKPNRILLTALAFAVVATADARAHRGRDPLAELRQHVGAASAHADATSPKRPSMRVAFVPTADAGTLPRSQRSR